MWCTAKAVRWWLVDFFVVSPAHKLVFVLHGSYTWLREAAEKSQALKRSYEPEICRKGINIAVLTPIVKLISLAKASTHQQAVAGRVRPGVGLYWPDFLQCETSCSVRQVGLYWLGTLRDLDQIPWRAQHTERCWSHHMSKHRTPEKYRPSLVKKVV